MALRDRGSVRPGAFPHLQFMAQTRNEFKAGENYRFNR
jgi:hypothetical protein